MAPVWLACSLSLRGFVLFVTQTIDSLLDYDRQEQLDIKRNVDILAVFGRDGSKSTPPPLQPDVPAYLLRVETPLPRRHKQRRTRSGKLARIKA